MKIKRGFTLLEIVIVITVLGILTAVMIPIISNAIKNAKIENDKVLVDNINAILEADEPYNGRPSSGDEVLWILSGNGLEVEDTNYENHAFYWSIDDNKVLIYNSEEECVLYPEELKKVDITETEVEEKVSSNEWFPIAGDYTYNELAYKITYYVNGKKIKFYGKTSYDGTIDKLELPMPNVYGAYSEDYEFNGWYTNDDLTGNKINKIIIPPSTPSGDSGELVLERLENLVFYSSFSKIPTAPNDYCTNNPNAEICQDNYCELNPDSEACDDPYDTPEDYCTANPNAEVCRDPVTSKTKYSIVYHTNGGTLNNPVTSYYGPLDEAITLPIPTRYGYNFVGWYTTYNFELGTDIDSLEEDSTGNKVLYALWTKVEMPVYSISYELNGGTNPDNAPTEYDGTQEIILPTPTRYGYSFIGWYENEDLTGEAVTNIEIGSTGDKVFYAKWNANMNDRPNNHTYYITYELNGGTLYDPPTVIDGTKDFYLYTPLKRGYNFGGWYLTKDFSEETPIEVIPKEEQDHDYTVYAKWIAVEYDINYNLNGGSWQNSNTVNYVYTIDRVVQYTQEVVYEGHAFVGWFDNPECNGEPVLETSLGDTGEKTLYAKWDANKANIYYHVPTKIKDKLDMSSWQTTFTFNQEVILPVPEVAGYNFIGWFENIDLTGDPITKIEKGTVTSKFLYAKFDLITYNINWVVNGGTWQEGSQPPVTYNIEDNTININDYIIGKHYYEFSGWYVEEDFTGAIQTTIEKGTTGDITLYGKWEGVLLVLPAEFNGGTLQDRTIDNFAEELIEDINTFTYDAGVTATETDLEHFKKTTVNISYLWGNGNKKMLDKYKWFFKFAADEISTAAKASGYDVTYAFIYESVMKMFNALIGEKYITDEKFIDKNYIISEEDHLHALDTKQYHTPKCEEVNEKPCTHEFTGTGIYNLLVKNVWNKMSGVGDAWGNNKTLFRSWLHGLINSNLYYAADIYRGCMVDYSIPANMERFNKAYTGNEIEVRTKNNLPEPIKKGYEFLGWYDNADEVGSDKYLSGTKYTTSAQIYDYFIQNPDKKDSFKLYAKWEEIPRYEIEFIMNGGHWEDKSLDNFIKELVYIFNIPYNDGESDTEVTKNNFYSSSKENISLVWYDAAALNKYQWFLEFAKEEINNYAPSNYTNTREFMTNITTKKADGTMRDDNINYFNPSATSKYNSTAIDILCEWIHCLINRNSSSVNSNRSWIPDYSKQDNIERFYAKYYETDNVKTYYEGDSMPTPIRDGYVFLGWYNDAGYKVDEFTTSGKLRALWQKTVKDDEELAEAIKNANAGNLESIVLSPNTIYTGNYTIEKSWLTIVGPNYGINPNTSQRNPEAIFKGTFNIAESVVGIVIDGIAFTEGAKIKAATTSNFYFRNNYVYDTNAGDEWLEGEKYNNGFMTILLPSGSLTDDVISTKLSSNLNILNNKFEEVGDVNIYIANSKDVNIKDNVFIDFQYDAIRFGDAFTAGEINIISNKFIQSTKNSGYNGIYFRMYGKTKDNSSTNIITIKYNEFKNIGNIGETYTGAITARNYKEFGATFDISNNYFESCYNYIRLRNNADLKNYNNANYKWSATVENNIFKGIPEKYYFIAKESESDTVYSDTVFKANYYVNADGTLITTLDSSKFKDVSSIGTTLTQEPIVEKPAI